MQRTDKEWHYRHHLEGLRGVAATLVMLYHADVPIFRFGYIGVDIFFVLSGFLITSLLLNELESSGDIDFWRFFAKRARRLLPPALVVLIITFVAFDMASTIHFRNQFGRDFVFSALYVSNWHFLLESTNYFTAQQVPSPVLHFWSLAVEEQFYLTWPFVLFGLWKYTGRRGVAAFVAPAVAFGYVGTWFLYEYHGSHAHFATYARIYELLAGGALSLWVRYKKLPRSPYGRIVSLVSLVGLLCLSSVSFGLTPVEYGALATVGTCTLIMGAEHLEPHAHVGILTSRPAVFLGRISYASYLWHWPLLLFANLLGWAADPGSLLLAFQLFVVTTVAAWLTQLCIEAPVSKYINVRSDRSKRGAVLLGSTLSLIVACCIAVPTAQSERQVESERGVNGAYAREVDSQGAVAVNRILLFGDSTAGMWWPAFKAIIEDAGQAPELLWSPYCSWFSSEWVTAEQARRKCHQTHLELDDRLNKGRYATIVLISHAFTETPLSRNGVHEPGSQMWTQQLENDIRSFLAKASVSGTKVVLVQPTHRLAEQPMGCVVRMDQSRCDKRVSRSPGERSAHLLLSRLTASDCRVIDLEPILCPSGTCNYVDRGILVRKDDLHVSEEYAKIVTSDVERVLKEAGVTFD